MADDPDKETVGHHFKRKVAGTSKVTIDFVLDVCFIALFGFINWVVEVKVMPMFPDGGVLGICAQIAHVVLAVFSLAAALIICWEDLMTLWYRSRIRVKKEKDGVP